MNRIKILSSNDVKALVSMDEAIETVVTAYRELSVRTAQMPVRTITDLGKEELTLFYKPSYVPSEHVACVKLLSHRKQGAINGNPALQGTIVLIDSVSNATKAIVDGTYLTALRTGAASGVGTRYLARKDASVLALFGTGAQGHTQFEAVCCEREIKRAYIFANTSVSIDRFIEYYKDKTNVELVVGRTENISEADIICTATPSEKSLFETKDLKRGVHINAIGSYSSAMQELPDDIFMSASLYVDHKESCFAESGDVLRPLAKNLLPQENYKGEIGELIINKISGRSSDEEITVFKSVGIAIQDLITANYAYKKACKQGIGTSVDM